MSTVFPVRTIIFPSPLVHSDTSTRADSKFVTKLGINHCLVKNIKLLIDISLSRLPWIKSLATWSSVNMDNWTTKSSSQRLQHPTLHQADPRNTTQVFRTKASLLLLCTAPRVPIPNTFNRRNSHETLWPSTTLYDPQLLDFRLRLNAYVSGTVFDSRKSSHVLSQVPSAAKNSGRDWGLNADSQTCKLAWTLSHMKERQEGLQPGYLTRESA